MHFGYAVTAQQRKCSLNFLVCRMRLVPCSGLSMDLVDAGWLGERSCVPLYQASKSLNCSLFCVLSSLIARISASSRNICFAWMESRSQYEKVTTCLIFLGVMVWLIDLIWPQCIAQDGSLCKKIPPFPVLLGGRQMLPTAVDANRRHIVRLSLPFTQLRLLCMWASWSCQAFSSGISTLLGRMTSHCNRSFCSKGVLIAKAAIYFFFPLLAGRLIVSGTKASQFM